MVYAHEKLGNEFIDNHNSISDITRQNGFIVLRSAYAILAGNLEEEDLAGCWEALRSQGVRTSMKVFGKGNAVTKVEVCKNIWPQVCNTTICIMSGCGVFFPSYLSGLGKLKNTVFHKLSSERKSS